MHLKATVALVLLLLLVVVGPARADVRQFKELVEEHLGLVKEVRGFDPREWYQIKATDDFIVALQGHLGYYILDGKRGEIARQGKGTTYSDPVGKQQVYCGRKDGKTVITKVMGRSGELVASVKLKHKMNFYAYDKDGILVFYDSHQTPLLLTYEQLQAFRKKQAQEADKRQTVFEYYGDNGKKFYFVVPGETKLGGLLFGRYVLTANDRGKLLCVDRGSGREHWSLQRDGWKEVAHIMPHRESESLVAVWTADSVTLLDLKMKAVLYEQKVPGQLHSYKPCVGKKAFVYITSKGKMGCLAPGQKPIRWQVDVQPRNLDFVPGKKFALRQSDVTEIKELTATDLLIVRRTVHVKNKRYLYWLTNFDPETGKRRWHKELKVGLPEEGSRSSDGKFYVIYRGGRLMVVSVATGKSVSLNIPGVEISPVYVAHGKLFANVNDKLYLIKPYTYIFSK